jgi:hypothetical protein
MSENRERPVRIVGGDGNDTISTAPFQTETPSLPSPSTPKESPWLVNLKAKLDVFGELNNAELPGPTAFPSPPTPTESPWLVNFKKRAVWYVSAKLNPHSHKIFGIGYPKTGSVSLAAALRILKYAVLHDYSAPIYNLPLENDLSPLKNLVFDAYINVYPTSFYLYDMEFPKSKFILTTRDPESWFASIETHRKRMHPSTSEERDLQQLLSHANQQVHYIFMEDIKSYGCISTRREAFIYKFEQHIREVKYYFRDRPDDLLVLPLESKKKEALLAKFLSARWPLKTRYPHENWRR